MDFQKFANEINRDFDEPFCEKGLVQAQVRNWDGEEILSLKIGNRDVQFGKDGETLSSGTFLGGCRK